MLTCCNVLVNLSVETVFAKGHKVCGLIGVPIETGKSGVTCYNVGNFGNFNLFTLLCPCFTRVVVNNRIGSRSLEVSGLSSLAVIEENIYTRFGNHVEVKAVFALLHSLTGPCNVRIGSPSVAINVCPICGVVNINLYNCSCSIASLALAVFTVAVTKSCKILCIRLGANRASPCSGSCRYTSNGLSGNLINVVARGSLNNRLYGSSLKGDGNCTTILCNLKVVVRAGISSAPSVVLCALELIASSLNVGVNLDIRIGSCIICHIIVLVGCTPVATAKSLRTCNGPGLACSCIGSNSEHAHHKCHKHKESYNNFACVSHKIFLSLFYFCSRRKYYSTLGEIIQYVLVKLYFFGNVAQFILDICHMSNR